MSWFDEQLRQRYEMDEEMLETAYRSAANAVMGNSFSVDGVYTEEAIGQIFNYYHMDFPYVPDNIKDPMERIEYACRSVGIMHRDVDLTGKWYKEAAGAMMGKNKETDEVVALIPGKIGGYHYFDKITQKNVNISQKNAGMFEVEALCFYKPLPLRSITKKDLIKFCISTVTKEDILYALLFLALSTFLGVIMPKITYFMFSVVVEVGKISLLGSTIVFALSIVISSNLITLLYHLATSRIGSKMKVGVDAAVMMRVLSLPQKFFDNYSSGSISMRIAYIQQFCQQMMDVVILVGLSGVFSLAYFSQIAVYTPNMALPMLGIIILALAFLVLTIRKLTLVSEQKLLLETKNHGLSYDTISGIQKIKLSGAEKRMFSRFATDFSGVARVAYNPPLMVKLRAAIILLITLSGQFIMYYLGLKDKVGVAEFYASWSAYTMITAGITTLVQVSVIAENVFAYLELARPILDTAPETSEHLKTVTSLGGSIELTNVFFRYDENMRDIISDLSFSVKPGQYVALVGRSGCGKSTLIRLLLGFEKPRMGTVSYDGKNLTLLDKPSLRRHIGTVMQNDGLFSDSIYANIAVCAPGLTMDGAWKAAELAGIADDIRELPMGMHTLVSEGSGGFSGGQRQRLIIARAIASNPKILIFDEATSALDNKTQKVVSDSLDQLKCTRIVVAHRLSTIRHCDKIFVMDQGHITEEGTYEELIAKNGLFAELVKRQRLDVDSDQA